MRHRTTTAITSSRASTRLRACLFAMTLLAIPAAAHPQGPRPGAGETPLTGLDSLLAIRITTAAKHDQTGSEAASAVTVVTADDIRRFGFQTLGQLLESIRGFYTSYDRNYTYIGVRGFGRPTDYNNRILLLLDGHTVTEGIWGMTPIGSELGIDLRSLERVEVVRGPSSTLYGTGAMLAIINLVPKSAERIDGADLSLGTGSFGRRNAAAHGGLLLPNGLGITVSALGERVDGGDLYFAEYDAPATADGIARGLDWERREAAGATLTWRQLSVQLRHMNRRKGIPTGAFDVAFGDTATRTGDAMTQLEARYAGEVGARHGLVLRAYADRYRYRGLYPHHGSFTEEAVADVLGGEASLRWDIASGHSLTIGSEYRGQVRGHYSEHEEGLPGVVIDRTSHNFSLYAQDELRLAPGLTAIGGARFDHHSLAGDAVSPRAALVLDAARGTTVKALYGEAFRAPSVYETYYAIDSVAGLGPERLRSFELVAEQRVGGGIVATASLYEFRMRDLVDQAIDTVEYLPHYANLGAVRSRGLEVGVRAQLLGVSAYASYSHQNPRDVATDSILTNSPRHLAKGGVALPLGPVATLSARARYESGRKTVQGTLTGDAFVSDLHFTLTPWAPHAGRRRGLEGAELSIGVRNLFDADYATPGGIEHRQAAIVQDGRTFTARVGWHF